MYQELYNHIRRYVPLSAEEESVLASNLSHRVLKKKEHLLTAGQVCHANYFIVKGCLRLYIVTESGHEQTVQFAIENWWMTDYNTLGTSRITHVNIQSVENTEIIVLDATLQEYVFTRIPQLERYFRLVLQRAYAAAIMRAQYMLEMKEEERYRHFSSAFPGFIQRIPQYMLASYLGFTPEFLSRIRAKKET